MIFIKKILFCFILRYEWKIKLVKNRINTVKNEKLVIWCNSYIHWKDFSNKEPNYVFKSKFWKMNTLGKNKNEESYMRKKHLQKTFMVKIINIFDQILILRASLIPSHTQMQISQASSWILTLLKKRYFTWKSSVV